MDKKTKNIIIWTAGAVVAVVIIIAAIVLHHNDIPYELTPEQTLAEMTNPLNTPGAQEIREMKSNQKVVFVDVRNPLEYNLHHMEGAINIPAEKILNDDFVESIRELEEQGNIIILYGTTPNQAAGPWMLLKQIGITNAKMFNGTFEQLTASGNITAGIYNEEALIDTTLLNKKEEAVKPGAPKKASTQPKPVIPQRVEPSAESGGGC